MKRWCAYVNSFSFKVNHMWNGWYEEIKTPRSFRVYDNNDNNNSIAETNDDVAAAAEKCSEGIELKQNEAGKKWRTSIIVHCVYRSSCHAFRIYILFGSNKNIARVRHFYYERIRNQSKFLKEPSRKMKRFRMSASTRIAESLLQKNDQRSTVYLLRAEKRVVWLRFHIYIR